MQYVSVTEYLGKVELDSLSDELKANVNTLIPKINELLERFGSYRKVTSGFRSMEDHLRIYKDINAKRQVPVKVPMASKHLICAAIDLEDKDGKLKTWCLNNLKILKELGLYMEHQDYTPSWCHLQHISPKSNNRIFIP